MAAKALRVFVPTGVYPPDIGGPAAYVPLLEKHLPEHNLNVTVLPFRKVAHLPKGLSHLAYFWHALEGTLNADVVYAQDAVSVGVPARLAACIFRKPFIVKIVGDHVWEQGRQRFGVTQELDDFPLWPKAFYLRFLRFLQLFVVRTADHVIVPSQYLHKRVVTWGIQVPITVIHNSIELPEQIYEPDSVRHPLIVSVARLTPWKGIAGVIDAVSDDTSWSLVVIGDGPLRGSLQSYAERAGSAERVRFIGSLTREQTFGWMRVADVFVLNSTYEGMPHALIEAMAIGTPVVATDIPGNREVVTHGVDGLLVLPGNSAALKNTISQTINDSDGSRRRVAAARIRAAEFSAEKTMRELVEVFRSVVAKAAYRPFP